MHSIRFGEVFYKSNKNTHTAPPFPLLLLTPHLELVLCVKIPTSPPPLHKWGSRHPRARLRCASARPPRDLERLRSRGRRLFRWSELGPSQPHKNGRSRRFGRSCTGREQWWRSVENERGSAWNRGSLAPLKTGTWRWSFRGVFRGRSGESRKGRSWTSLERSSAFRDVPPSFYS